MTYHVISLVITSNDIPLSPTIALAYHFVSNGSPFWYTKPHPSIVEKRTSRYPICWEALHPSSYLLGFTSPPPFLLLLPYNYWTVSYTNLLRIKPSIGTRKAWWPSAQLVGCNNYGHCRKSTSWFIVYLRMDLVGWLIWSLWEKSEALGWMTRHSVTIQELLRYDLL